MFVLLWQDNKRGDYKEIRRGIRESEMLAYYRNEVRMFGWANNYKLMEEDREIRSTEKKG